MRRARESNPQGREAGGFQIRCHTVRRALRGRLMITETGARVKAMFAGDGDFGNEESV